MTGRTVAHFEILEKLGQGGMGAVYKARDTHLDRLVAVKVLRQDRVADPERRRRFIQEAKAASALNHPNIVTTYDIDRAGDLDFIAMELIRGRTLDAAIAGKGLTVAEAMKHGIQIAGAMTAAHGAGIVHRDLKPANIMITEQGLVKILDFGLAKLTESAPAEGAATETLAKAATEGGAILGTVAYMSPEQAEGRPIDARSDIFSFGVVLYEMLSGRRAFQRESKLSTLAAILHQEAAPLTQTVAGVPHELERIIARCLRKDPERRFQLMKEVAIALEELKEESESGRQTVAVAQPPRGARARWWAAAAALALAAGLTGWLLRRTPETPELQLRPLTADSGLSTTPAISPDGKLVAYASDRASDGNLDIWVQPLTGGAQPIRLTRHEADDLEPSFSPDGGLVAFYSKRGGGGVYIVPSLGGGEERLLVRGGDHPRFSPDGQWLAYSLGRPLSDSKVFIVPAAGGPPRRIAEGIRWAAWPVWSPDGKSLLFAANNNSSNPGFPEDYWIAPLDGGEPVNTGIAASLRAQGVALPQDRFGDWIGDAFVFGAGQTGGGLWQISLPAKTGKASGKARRLTRGTAAEFAPRGASPEAPLKMVFASGAFSRHLWVLPLDANSGKARGEIRPLPYAGGDQGYPAASADGRKMVYYQTGPGGSDLRVRDLEKGKETVVASGPYRARLSPDGTKVAYSDPRKGIFLVDAAGGEVSKLLSHSRGFQIYGWSPDGRSVVYYDRSPIRFSLLDVASGTTSEFIAHPSRNIHGAEFSPDQRWVAFHAPVGSRSPLYVAPVSQGRAAPESDWIEIAGGPARHLRPWWSPDGKLLYYVSETDGSQCVWARRLDGTTRRPVGEPFAVYHFHSTRRAPSPSGLASFGPAVCPTQIIFSLYEQTSNIWLASGG